MGALQSTGTPIGERVLFNTGYITVNGGQLVDVQDITINKSFTEMPLKAMNSIKIRQLRRKDFKCGATFKVAGHQSQTASLFFGGSSAVSGGLSYSVVDGQQSVPTFYITCYADESVSESVQFQFSNAVFTVDNLATSLETFGEHSITVVATDVTMFEATSAAS